MHSILRPHGFRLALALLLFSLLAIPVEVQGGRTNKGNGPFASSGAFTAMVGDIETCDAPQFTEWQISGETPNPIIIADGVCVLDPSAVAEYRQPVLDFRFQFDAQVPEDGSVTVRLSWFIDHWVEAAITPQQVTITEIFAYGGDASPANARQIGSGKIDLTPGSFHTLVLTHQKRALVVEIDGEPAVTAALNALHAGPQLSVSAGVLLDNLQVEALPLMQPGERLPGLSADLLASVIAFRGDDNALWWVYPDGSGLAKTEPEIRPGEMRFSPDGALLAVDDNGLMRVVDAGGRTVLPAWRSTRVRRGAFDWTPNGRLLVVKEDSALEVAELDPQSAKTVKTYPLPKDLGERGFSPQRITRVSCSPAGRVALMELVGMLEGSSVTRYLVYDLDSGDARLFPGSPSSRWWPDGSRITIANTEASGYVEYPSLAQHEQPQQDHPLSGFSPNGQFATRATGRASGESILDLENNRVLAAIPGQVSWAPDSRHIVYPDNGRITVQNMLEPAYVQIAQGTSPHWQPRPEIAGEQVAIQTPAPTASFTGAASSTGAASPTDPSIPTRTPRPTTAITTTGVVKTAAAPTQAMALPPAPGAVEPTLAADKAPGQAASPLLAAIITGMLLFVGLVSGGAGLASLLRPAKRICPTCGRVNRLENASCMFCATSLTEQPPVRPNRPLSITLASAGLVLAISGLALLVLQPSTPASRQATEGAAETALSPTLPAAQRISAGGLPVFPPAAPRSDSCPSFRLETAGLDAVYAGLKKSDDRRLAKPTPSIELTLQPDATQAIEMLYSMVPGCLMERPSFSPDGQRVLVPYSDPSANLHWNAMYETATFRPLWAKSLEFAMEKVLWAPDGSRLAARSRDRWFIFDTATGEQISAIPDSSRSQGWCSDPRNAENLHWLPDSRRLLRKITNTVQVIHSDTGELLSETPVDDTAMGFPSSEVGSTTCSHNLFWSPDGNAFITTSNHPGGGDRLYHVRKWGIATGRLLWDRQIAAAPGGAQSWSPDGSRFLYRLSEPFTLIDADTGDPLEGAKPPPANAAATGTGAAAPARLALWSPDSRALAIQDNSNGDILLFDLSTGEAPLLSPPPVAHPEILSWLPDGRLLVMAQPDTSRGPAFWLAEPRSGKWVELGKRD